MYSGFGIWRFAAALALLLMLAACGGSDSGSGFAPPPGSGPTQPERMQAAEDTASTNAKCTSITPFYWEIGDKDGALDSGTGGDGSSSPPNSETGMSIASASKWVFGAYALEKLDVSSSNPLTADEIQHLNFTSGYDNMDEATCVLYTTVGGCFHAANMNGGYNSDQSTSDVGDFFYNSGHMQAMAVNQFNLGNDYISTGSKSPKLAAEIETYIGQDVDLLYTNASLAGGISTTPAMYATFLRKILSGDLRMHDYLGKDAVCTHANSTDCPTAIFSPVNQSVPGDPNNVSDEAWHYSLGHWVEDDPSVGDGAFSSPGAEGFYPWIDSTKTYYGILARYVPISTVDSLPPSQKPWATSVYCGRLIRKAWLTGQAQ